MTSKPGLAGHGLGAAPCTERPDAPGVTGGGGGAAQAGNTFDGSVHYQGSHDTEYFSLQTH